MDSSLLITLFLACLCAKSYCLVLTVAGDGTGNYKTIGAAVAAAPNSSSSQVTILIRPGKYNEQVLIPVWKTNLLMKGESANTTLIFNNIRATRRIGTAATATIGVDADGFVAQDITISNTAGRKAEQAVAFRSAGDRTVLYRCVLQGYQDTLYTQVGRHFIRESQIYGTVDFVFGDSRAVFQNTDFFFRLPLPGKPDVLTAQGRQVKDGMSGIVIQNCTLSAAPDSPEADNGAYLGRPWKKYSRTVIMESDLEEVVNVAGWLPWQNDNSTLKDAEYIEYNNRGPRIGPAGRINQKVCPGCRLVSDRRQVEQFTVRNFIQGLDWIPRTGVPDFVT